MAKTTKLSFIAVLFLSACASTAWSQGNGTYPCLSKLMPCAAFIKSPNPPSTCCIPLKDAIDKEVDCLCSLFNNQEILKTFNVTQDDALKLPKNCGNNADLSKCKTSGSGGKDKPPPATPTPPTPTPPTPPTPTPNTPSKTPAKSPANSGGRSTMSAAAVLLASGILYLTMSY